jgi:basic membrane lipoprotein Med (substrate-binding protein (PBP1-ABC) superfamily)
MHIHELDRAGQFRRATPLGAALGLALLVGFLLIVAGIRAVPVGAVPVAVGLVTDEATLADRSWNWLSYQGLLRAETELGVAGTVYTSTSSADYSVNLQQCVDDGNDLCLAVGFPLQNATWDAAQANPGTDFAILDVTWQTYPSNLRGTTFVAEEAGYLAGTLAGLMTTSDVIGAVGGMQIPPVTAFTESYRNAAQCIKPSVTALVTYTGTFGDPGLGAQVAQQQMAHGADVIFAAAGGTGFGAVLTATQSGVWAIGVDVDFYVGVFENGSVAGADKLLSSAMKRLDNAVYLTIKDIVSGTFTSGTVVYDLQKGGVGLAPFHEADASVPQSVRDVLDWTEKGIIAGAIDPLGPCPSRIYLPLVARNAGP